MRKTLCLLLIATPAFAAAPLQFWNLTGETVTDLRLAPAGTGQFGANECLNDPDHSVDSDERLKLTNVQPGRYDVKLTLQSGKQCTVKGVTLKGTGKYAFSIDGKSLTDCTGGH